MRALSTARLSGRAEIVYDSCLESSDAAEVKGSSSGDLVFYLDGAHSPESMEACAKWFASAVKEEGPHQSSVTSFSSKLQTLEQVSSNTCVEQETDKRISMKARFSNDPCTL